MADEYDPDERFSLYPMDGEEALQRLLGVDEDEAGDMEDEDS